MTFTCPKCSHPLPLAVAERIKPFASSSYAFDCPNCGAGLIYDYWNAKHIGYRLLYALGAVILFWGLSAFGVGRAALAVLVLCYLAGGWFVFARLRQVVLLNTELRQGHRP